MKKILIILFLLTSASVFAQVSADKWQGIPTGSDGAYRSVQNTTDIDIGDSGLVKPQLVILADTATVQLLGTIELTPAVDVNNFPDTQTVRGTVSVDNFPSVVNTLGLPDTAKIWVSDTTNNVPDSVSRFYPYGAITDLLDIAPNRQNWTFTPDSTAEISFTGDFIAGTVFEVRAGTTVESWTLNNFIASELFIRKKSAYSGAMTYRFCFTGR